MRRPEEETKEIGMDLLRYKVDIAALQSTRWCGRGQKYNTLYYIETKTKIVSYR